MFRISRLGRLAAAAVLVASGATVALTSTATAANTPVNYDCVTQYTYLDVNNSDTLTITITASTGCGFIILDNPQGGALGTATLNGNPLTAGTPVATANGDVVVYTAPASGNGQDGFAFLPNLQSPPGPQITITFPSPAPRNDTLVDNGNGSMTINYDPTTPNENMWVSIFPNGTTCAPVPASPTGRVYVLAPDAPYSPLGASPVVVAAGSPAMTGVSPYASATIAAGSYQACLYFSLNGQGTLVQALPITFSEVAPTPDPVVPAFTG